MKSEVAADTVYLQVQYCANNTELGSVFDLTAVNRSIQSSTGGLRCTILALPPALPIGQKKSTVTREGEGNSNISIGRQDLVKVSTL